MSARNPPAEGVVCISKIVRLATNTHKPPSPPDNATLGVEGESLGHAVIRIDLGEDRRLEGRSLRWVARRAAISSIEAVEFRLHGTRRRDVTPRLGRGHVSASFRFARASLG